MTFFDAQKLDELKATGNLPSPRGIAAEVIRLSLDDYVTTNQLARVIQADPALAARIIKAANSAASGTKRSIAVLNEAVMVLGIPIVRQMALGFSLVSHYKDGSCKHFNYHHYWVSALVTAIATQIIAQRMRLIASEETFICGLLCNVGQLALATLYPQQYSVILSEVNQFDIKKLAQREQLELGGDHLELSLALMMDWGVSNILTSAVEWHLDPKNSRLEPSTRSFSIAAALKVARQFAWLVLLPLDQRKNYYANIFQAGSLLGLDTSALTEVGEEILVQWKDWAKMLDMPLSEMGVLIEKQSTIMPAESQPSVETPPRAQIDFLRVVVVDDDSALTQVLKKLLMSLGHTVAVAHNGREALEVILRFRPDLVITDWAMPEMDGIQLVRALRETKLGQALYILILTSFENDDRLVEAFESGVDDYIVKPFTPRVLQARLQSAMRSIKQKNTMSGDIEDMRKFASELAINNRRLQQAVLTDPLTGLPNRRYALDRLEQEWAATFRRKGSLSCIMVDVDHFKSVNDRFGHDVGDEVLRYVGNLLRTKARLQDAICRIGGEEFLVICPDTNEVEVFRAGERLRSIFAENTYVAGDFKLPVTLSMGVATAGVNCNNTSEFIKQADQAVYRAKANGRNCVSV